MYRMEDLPGSHNLKAEFRGANNPRIQYEMNCRFLFNVIDTSDNSIVWSQVKDISCSTIITRDTVFSPTVIRPRGS